MTNIRARSKISTSLRYVAATLIHTFAVFVVLAACLATWTEFHIELRKLGAPFVMIGYLIFLYGSISFAASSLLGLKILGDPTNKVRAHLGIAGFLYIFVAFGVFRIVTFLPEHLEGFDIAFKTSVMIAAYATLFNAVYIWIYYRAA